MAPVALLSLVSQFLTGTAWPFLKKHWKLVLQATTLIWAIVCSLTHCAGVRTPWDNQESIVTVKVDTLWVFPDSTAIFALHGFDTLPRYVQHLEHRLRFRPKAPVFHPLSSCSDSVVALLSHSKMQSIVIAECDSAYADAIAVRSYGDTLRNDSIEVSIGFRVQGHLRGEPSITYRYLAPYPVITIERIIQMPPTAPNRRVYLEGGIGVAMTWDNELNAISGSLGLGYENRKGWSFGPRGTFNQNFYLVEGTLRKSFGVGRRK